MPPPGVLPPARRLPPPGLRAPAASAARIRPRAFGRGRDEQLRRRRFGGARSPWFGGGRSGRRGGFQVPLCFRRCGCLRTGSRSGRARGEITPCIIPPRWGEAWAGGVAQGGWGPPRPLRLCRPRKARREDVAERAHGCPREGAERREGARGQHQGFEAPQKSHLGVEGGAQKTASANRGRAEGACAAAARGAARAAPGQHPGQRKGGAGNHPHAEGRG
ncbi:unnamed protein product, partial [Closterium sp. NIES-65]